MYHTSSNLQRHQRHWTNSDSLNTAPVNNEAYLIGLPSNKLTDYLPTLGRPHQLYKTDEWLYKWVFPKIVVPQNRWFIMENPIKMDDLGGATIFGNTYINVTHEKPLEVQKNDSHLLLYLRLHQGW